MTGYISSFTKNELIQVGDDVLREATALIQGALGSSVARGIAMEAAFDNSVKVNKILTKKVDELEEEVYKKEQELETERDCIHTLEAVIEQLKDRVDELETAVASLPADAEPMVPRRENSGKRRLWK